jgi:hypothetical protein
MTGPEHYDSAQLWLYKAENEGARGGEETVESCAAIAQVHATLALTAATALGTEQYGPDSTAWHGAAATTRTKPVGED